MCKSNKKQWKLYEEGITPFHILYRVRFRNLNVLRLVRYTSIRNLKLYYLSYIYCPRKWPNNRMKFRTWQKQVTWHERRMSLNYSQLCTRANSTEQHPLSIRPMKDAVMATDFPPISRTISGPSPEMGSEKETQLQLPPLIHVSQCNMN